MKFVIRNRGYLRALQEIAKIMANKEILDLYDEYLEETEGDKMAAAILVLASIQKMEKTGIENPGKPNFEMRRAPEMPPGYTIEDPKHTK
jgi:hypothetical protein